MIIKHKTLVTLFIISGVLGGCSTAKDASSPTVANLSKEEAVPKTTAVMPTAADSQETQVAAMSKAQALAIDAKHYARAYEVSHTEAMRRMLVMNDAQQPIDALKEEFADR